MKIGPKYKIARRLGANIFEKTQTAKFALRQERRTVKRTRGPKGQFAIQILEKQKARLTYFVNERQFKKYVKEAIANKGTSTIDSLFERLEMRLDNTVYRLGWAPTRQAARQMVNHGHILVNGSRLDIPSYIVEKSDKITPRLASLKKPLFVDFDEKLKTVQVPSWLSFDADKKTASVDGKPKYAPSEHLFNLGQVIEFYSR